MLVADEVTTRIFEIINASPIASVITGSVYKDWRPAKSTKEDVVVNTIVMSGSESIIQDATCNVNIHVASLVTADGLMPNNARFTELIAIVKPLLKESHGKDFIFWTEQTTKIKEQGQEHWYLNFRLRLKQHNTINN